MIPFFSKFFKKKQKKIYNFIEIDAQELANYPNGIHDVLTRKIDGFVIRNVVSKEEAAGIISAFEALPDAYKEDVYDRLLTFPRVFAKIKTGDNWKPQLKIEQLEWERLFKEIPSLFPFDYTARIGEVLSKMSGNFPVEIAKGLDDEGIYCPTSIRKLFAKKGTMDLHCGRFFHDILPDFYTHLKEISDIKNQMSYFVALQAAESGGELTLYDMQWKDAESTIKGSGDILQGKDGKTYDVTDEKQVKREQLKPGVGDMVLFAGSSIWHRVERGSTTRVTMGGFISKATGKDSFYYWS